ncbi:MAG: toprim domain-containing protein [Bacteroidetes bacterium]|nr:toprim domain-containing protein [Bacteroidota bacterium]
MDNRLLPALKRYFWDLDVLMDWEIGFDASGPDWVEIHFPYRSIDGKAVNIKTIRYGLDLKRKKDGTRFIGSGIPVPFYGVHQINQAGNKGKPIALVESEKTVLTLYRWMPKYVWLASGGTSGVTKEKARDLTGRDILIYFDADEPGRKGAEKAAQLLTQYGCRVKIMDPFPDRVDGWDLADEFLRVHDSWPENNERLIGDAYEWTDWTVLSSGGEK